MELYEVKLLTYEQFFVEAKSFDDAASKTLKYVKHLFESRDILDSDGSLGYGINYEEPKILSVTFAADCVIR